MGKLGDVSKLQLAFIKTQIFYVLKPVVSTKGPYGGKQRPKAPYVKFPYNCREKTPAARANFSKARFR
jgi:hypothetical protein